MQEGGLPKETENVEEFIAILKEHEKKCEAEGKYVEAEMAKNRLRELMEKQHSDSLEQLKSRQLQQRLEVEDLHLQEFNKFNENWDKKMMDFEAQAQAMEQVVQEKNKQKVQEFREQFLKEFPEIPKASSELLNLRKIEQVLAKRKDYAEAHKVQQKCTQLEQEEKEKWEQAKQNKLKVQENILIRKQETELANLRKRMQTQMDEQRKQRAMELEKLLQRYQNVKKDLENAQTVEKNKLSKSQSIATSPRQTVPPSRGGGK